MSDRTEQISHFSILFRAVVFTVLVALMSGRIEAKSPIDLSRLRSLSQGYGSRLADTDCQQNTCNLSNYLRPLSDGKSVSSNRSSQF